MMVLGFGSQLFQFHHYVEISAVQRHVLRALIDAHDGTPDGKRMVILDKSNLLGHPWMFPDGTLMRALSYFFARKIGPVEVCHYPSMEWQRVDSLGRKGKCFSESNGWMLRPPAPVEGPGYAAPGISEALFIPHAQNHTITVNPDFSKNDDGHSGIGNNRHKIDSEVTKRRSQNMLADFHWADRWKIFKDQLASDSYYWSFGTWWSLEIPTRGYGWREAEWAAHKLSHVSTAWMQNDFAAIEFHLIPKKGRYRFTGKFESFASDIVRSDMKVRLNRRELDVKIDGNGFFDAKFDSSYLKDGLNEVEFHAPVNSKYYGLAARMDWFDVRPE